MVADATHGGGADVVLDIVGGDYLERNIRALAREGRIMEIASRRGSVHLRHQSPDDETRADLGDDLRADRLQRRSRSSRKCANTCWPLIESGRVRPIIDSVFPIEDAPQAHIRMESSTHIGKILLQVR